MSLRKRLIWVHAAFAAFALAAAVATVYAVRFQVRQAALHFEQHTSEIGHVDDCRSDIRTLDVHLHELISGNRPPNDPFESEIESTLTRLRDVAQFASVRGTRKRPEFADSVAKLEDRIDHLVALVRAEDLVAAQVLFKTKIESELLGPIEADLSKMHQAVEANRQVGSLELLDRDSKLLLLAALIGIAGVALVVTGMLIVRRRLVQPIQKLQAAAQTFAGGALDHRVELPVRDELGELADAMNGMAAALYRSQRKYQGLFENLRDTVVICDRSGNIQECHSGDTNLLVSSSESCAGQNVFEIWPGWQFHGLGFKELIAKVLETSGPLRFSDVAITTIDGQALPVDVVAYRVHYAADPFVAIVFRNVSERYNLQKTARRADTMEAAVNFARGIAHDFKNLLHSAQVSLDGIRETAEKSETIERATTAIEACRQAANLSRRLTRFSTADEGEPESVQLAETVRLILDALDNDLFDGIDVKVSGECSGCVLMDRDHLTQIVLNLIYNAIDAMPGGGSIRVSISRASFAHPLTDRPPSPHLLLAVQDTGHGIDSAALEHVFEPLYSTKPRSDAGPRGMGLAVVYAAVNHAGGFVQIESVPGQGTTLRVYLPEIPRAARPVDPAKLLRSSAQQDT
jgi:signal transduction histidine kinase